MLGWNCFRGNENGNEVYRKGENILSALNLKFLVNPSFANNSAKEVRSSFVILDAGAGAGVGIAVRGEMKRKPRSVVSICIFRVVLFL